MTQAPDKYAHVKLEGLALKPDEPTFIIRGQDVLAPLIIYDYANRVEGLGGDAHREHANDLRRHAAFIKEWQNAHPQYVKEPD